MYELLVESGEGKLETSPIYRSKILNGEFSTDFEGRQTIYEIFVESCCEYSERLLHGKRERFIDGSVGAFIWQSYE